MNAWEEVDSPQRRVSCAWSIAWDTPARSAHSGPGVSYGEGTKRFQTTRPSFLIPDAPSATHHSRRELPRIKFPRPAPPMDCWRPVDSRQRIPLSGNEYKASLFGRHRIRANDPAARKAHAQGRIRIARQRRDPLGPGDLRAKNSPRTGSTSIFQVFPPRFAAASSYQQAAWKPAVARESAGAPQKETLPPLSTVTNQLQTEGLWKIDLHNLGCIFCAGAEMDALAQPGSSADNGPPRPIGEKDIVKPPGSPCVGILPGLPACRMAVFGTAVENWGPECKKLLWSVPKTGSCLGPPRFFGAVQDDTVGKACPFFFPPNERTMPGPKTSNNWALWPAAPEARCRKILRRSWLNCPPPQ